MALTIVNQEIADREVEFGVRFEDDFVCICNDEDEARATRQMTGGEIVTREVFLTAWVEVA